MSKADCEDLVYGRKGRLGYMVKTPVHSQNDSGDLRGVAGGDGELGCRCGKAGKSFV